MLQFCTHIDFAYGLPTGTFSSKSVEQRNESDATCAKAPFCARLTNQRSAMPSLITRLSRMNGGNVFWVN